MLDEGECATSTSVMEKKKKLILISAELLVWPKN